MQKLLGNIGLDRRLCMDIEFAQAVFIVEIVPNEYFLSANTLVRSRDMNILGKG